MRGLVLAVALALLGGCLQAGAPSGGAGTSVQEVTFRVMEAHVVPGRCFDGAQAFGDVCHRLVVDFDNTAYLNDRDTGSLAWHAKDDRGRVHDFGASDADAVAGGERATLEVAFTMDDGPARLVELRYELMGGAGRASVPAYG